MAAKFDIRSLESRLPHVNSFDGNLVHGAKKFHAKTNRTGEGRPSSGGLVREHAKVVRDTGLDRYQRIEELWEEVAACPVCGHVEREFVLSRFALDVHRCGRCSHRYLSPRLKFDEICKLYADDKTSADVYTTPMQQEIDRRKYQYGIDLLDLLELPGRQRIMDIGCGAGVFLEVAFENAWRQCIGIDINERYKSRYEDVVGVQYVMSTFENISIDVVGGEYDCISMWSVLEHIYDVNKVVQQIRSLLKPGGLFLVLVPNVESLATRLMRERSPTFNWQHVSYFSTKSLPYLFEQNGFQCEHLETVVSEIDNIKSYMSGEAPYGGFGDPAGLFEFITPDYIHRNLLGSRLLGVFRKK